MSKLNSEFFSTPQHNKAGVSRENHLAPERIYGVNYFMWLIPDVAFRRNINMSLLIDNRHLWNIQTFKKKHPQAKLGPESYVKSSGLGVMTSIGSRIWSSWQQARNELLQSWSCRLFCSTDQELEVCFLLLFLDGCRIAALWCTLACCWCL